MSAKLVLSSLPVPYGLWSRLNLFRHGQMDSTDYALSCFDTHWSATQQMPRPPQTILELGPGDSLASSLIGCARGVRESFMIDSGPYATRRVEPYVQLRQRLSQLYPEAKLPEFSSVDGMLQATGGRYLTAGTESMRTVRDASVDLVFSQAVLEHVPLEELEEQFRQTRRVLHPEGVASHQVDLRDHLGNGLNNLRFSHSFWEKPRIHRSGFYTNRVRLPTYLEMFRRCRLKVRSLEVSRWPQLPIERRQLDRSFRDLSDEDLSVSSFRVVLVPGD